MCDSDVVIVVMPLCHSNISFTDQPSALVLGRSAETPIYGEHNALRGRYPALELVWDASVVDAAEVPSAGRNIDL